MIDFDALFKVSYGLYIVSSGDKTNGNGFISNTFFQVTSQPAKFAACCNKDNYTADMIKNHGAFAVSVLNTNTPPQIFGTFGYKSGRDINKMEGLSLKYGDTGVPIVLNSSIACLELKVVDIVDVGSHFMFIGELLNAEVLDDLQDPLTYSYYRNVKKGVAPKNAPTYVDKSKLKPKIEKTSFKKYKCLACGYIYDESTEEVRFDDLPDDWVCPACGTEKMDFIELENN